MIPPIHKRMWITEEKTSVLKLWTSEEKIHTIIRITCIQTKQWENGHCTFMQSPLTIMCKSTKLCKCVAKSPYLLPYTLCIDVIRPSCWGYAVADPGFVKRGGRESKFPARPEKVAQWGGGGGGGGLRHIFPPEFFGPTFTLLGRGTVRLPRPTSGVASKKKKKKKKKKARKN